MTFEEFFGAMLRPVYVVQMARGLRSRDGVHTGRTRSAETRYQRARRQIDDLVLQRADTIRDERRCEVKRNPLGVDKPPMRCEYQRGHGKVGPGPVTGPGVRIEPRMWDHGAPSQKFWWDEKEGAQG